MYSIEVDNIAKIYRKGLRATKVPAVIDLSFTVRKGSITGFVGPNGAGKTTAIKMMLGLVRPTKGVVRINGRDASSPSARDGVSFLPEQPYFYSHLTVEEMLRFTADLIEIPPGDINGEIHRVLETVELMHKKKMKIKELSKGMQQRLSMAQALLGNSHTFILDEPMSGMDPPGRRLFREILAGLRKEEKTVFFSTHVLDDVEAVCDDVVVLAHGRLTYSGKVAELLDEGFLGTEIVFKGQPAADECLKDKDLKFDKEKGKWTLFVPKNEDVESILRRIQQNGLFPVSIVKRNMTLEELLYRRKTGGAS